MRWKPAFIHTLREEPRDAEATSHKLMLRAGYVRKLSAGIYSYLPLGLRSLQRAMAIVREEMNRAGAEELVMPALHPAELWKATGRFDSLGDDKFAFKNRSGLEYVLGPTHEEVITQIAAESVQSYKDLPFTLYQIQGKFRDEARPRFGIIRSKEFLMKDAYSFDRDEAGLDASYERMREAYIRIFKRTGIDVLPVAADPGLMGGKVSHEFMVRVPFGEDVIVRCKKCAFTASREIARFKIEARAADAPKALERFPTPNLKSIEELAGSFKLKPEDLLKSLVYVADKKVVMVCLRGDHEVNEAKLKNLLKTSFLELAPPEIIEKVTGAPVGFSGPVGLRDAMIVLDESAKGRTNWVTGANKKGTHLKNVNEGRDFRAALTGDVRYATASDLCPECGSPVLLEKALELGHIFKLGVRYSEPLKAQYLDESGAKRDIVMGCYGIGVNRILAAAVEQSHDEKGIVWPKALAPYDLEIIPLGDSPEIQKETTRIEEMLEAAGFAVLVDDRDDRAGVKFNDADLIGIPVQVIVSDRNLKEGKLEVKVRKTLKAEKINATDPLPTLQNIYASL